MCFNVYDFVREIYPTLLGASRSQTQPIYTGAVHNLMMDIGEVGISATRGLPSQQANELVARLARIQRHASSAGWARSTVRQDEQILAHRAVQPSGTTPSLAAPGRGGYVPVVHPNISQVFSDLSLLSPQISQASLNRMIIDMSTSRSHFLGGQGMLEILRNIGFQHVRGLEVAASVAGGFRRYDARIAIGRGSVVLEAKNWTNLERTWDRRSRRQFLRDVTAPQRVYWVFVTELAPGPLASTRAATRGGMLNSLARQLFETNPRLRTQDGDFLTDLIARIREVRNQRDLERLIQPDARVHFLRNETFSVAQREHLVSSIESFFGDFSNRVLFFGR